MSINCRICKKEVPMTVGVCIPCTKENSRLREALEEIVTYVESIGYIRNVALKALEAGDE